VKNIDILPQIVSQIQGDANAVNECLKSLLLVGANSEGEAALLKAMSYATIDSGKRLRSFLCLESSRIASISAENAVIIAACIEMAHAYSLIHDDMPCLDNATERRGKPAVHIAFDEATALLAGNALYTYATEILTSDKLSLTPQIKLDLLHKFTRALGFKGMLGGQMNDLMMQKNTIPINLESLKYMQRQKTGCLFAFCASVGGLISGKNYEKMYEYGLMIGFLYQIVDDILDFPEETNDANSFVNIMGGDVDKVRVYARDLANEIVSKVNDWDGFGAFVNYILDFVK
jgi:farnesyl diphosphate synthase